MKTIYDIQMNRPDRVRPVNRRLILDNARHYSDRQEAGHVVHATFADNERGGAGTHYTIKARDEAGGLRVFTVRRSSDGHYFKS